MSRLCQHIKGDAFYESLSKETISLSIKRLAIACQVHLGNEDLLIRTQITCAIL